MRNAPRWSGMQAKKSGRHSSPTWWLRSVRSYMMSRCLRIDISKLFAIGGGWVLHRRIQLSFCPVPKPHLCTQWILPRSGHGMTSHLPFQPLSPSYQCFSYSYYDFQRTFLKEPESGTNIPIQAIGLSLYESLPTTTAEQIGNQVIRTQWLYVLLPPIFFSPRQIFCCSCGVSLIVFCG